MKILAIACLLIFSSCSIKYIHVTRMKPSSDPQGQYYENDSIKISYKVLDEYVSIKLQNKMKDGIKINWDEVSFSLNGKSYARVVHNLTGLTKINDLQPTTSIPPHSFIDDKLYPAENTAVVRGKYGYYKISGSYFPPRKRGEKKWAYLRSRIGDKLVIHLPFYINNSYSENNFEIEITDVKKIK